jgi:MFS family permease
MAAFACWVVQDLLGSGCVTVFFVGVALALFAFWVRRALDEPAVWKAARARPTSVSLGRALTGSMLGITIALTLMNASTMFAWWGFNTWVPSYLRQPVTAGGAGLSSTAMSWFIIVMQVGMWFGYVTFGFVSDRIGRKRTYVAYLLLAAALVLAYTSTTNPYALLFLGPITAFFATGYFSGFGAVTAEIYPTEVRATAQGLTYNIGRVASAAAPYVVGELTATAGYGTALSIASAAFLVAAFFWIFIPETRGRTLQ